MGIKQENCGARGQGKNSIKEALEFVRTGQNLKAYQVFVRLHYSNTGDPNLLLWIALTSPDPVEARRALEHSRSLDPTNPALVQVHLALLEREIASETLSCSGEGTPAPFTFPEAAEVFRDLSLIYKELGDSRKARLFQDRATWLKRV